MRRQQRALRIAAQQAIARLGVLPEALDRRTDFAVNAQRGIGGHVIGQGRGRVEEQRQVVFDAARREAVADVAVERRFRRVAFEYFAEAAAEARARRIVLRKLARRQQAHVGHRVERALAVDIEALDRLDFVVEQVDPVGQGAAHRKQVDQAAAHAVFARRDNLGDVLVAAERELRAQRVDVEFLALGEKERERRQIRRRRKPVQGGRRGDQQHVALAARRAVQRRQPLGDEILVRREVVVGQRLPVGKRRHAQRRREPGDFLGQALHGERLGADDGDKLAALGGGGRVLGERERIRRTGERRCERLPARRGRLRQQAWQRRGGYAERRWHIERQIQGEVGKSESI